MSYMELHELHELANDTVNYTHTNDGWLEGYLVFLWQELERLDPERWTANLRVAYSDFKERMNEV